MTKNKARKHVGNVTLVTILGSYPWRKKRTGRDKNVKRFDILKYDSSCRRDYFSLCFKYMVNVTEGA